MSSLYLELMKYNHIERKIIDQVLERSRNGEGVAAVLLELGLDVPEALVYLRDHHHHEFVAAKQEQIKRAKDKKEK